MSDNDQNRSSSLTQELIKETRSVKRWKNIRFFTGLILLLLIVFFVLSPVNLVTLGGPSNEKGYVSLVKLEGSIEPGKDFSAETVLPKLKDAFADTQSKGVILNINSGGGTPVQASIIHDAILDLKAKYHKKVIVVGEDLMASGAYYVAVAADKIYVNPNTITGSIGVIMKGFGFTELLKKVGVERRVYASGINKDRLDPFLPQNQEGIEKMRAVTAEIHNNFNQVVITGRKGKLSPDSKDLFSGDFWSGKTALKLGLVDGLGNLTEVLQKEFQVVSYKDYSGPQGLFKSFATQFGMALSAAFSDTDMKVLETIH